MPVDRTVPVNRRASKIIKAEGGVSKFATTLGYSIQRVSNWQWTGIPRAEYLHVTDKTAGRVTLDMLRAQQPT